MTRVLPSVELQRLFDDAELLEEIEAQDDAELVDQTAKITPPAAYDELTDGQRQILVFERQWWRHAGSKEQAIREQFEMSATRYYQTLNNLLDSPAALAYDPLVVGRLRRLRARRARARSAR